MERVSETVSGEVFEVPKAYERIFEKRKFIVA
jgi:hypothetical protein